MDDAEGYARELLDAPSPQEVEAERVEAQRRRLVCWMAAEGRRWDAEHPGRRPRELCSVEPVSQRSKHE